MKTKIIGIKVNRLVFINDKVLAPEESQRVKNISPSGFNWGYYGDGPAQLALGILLEFTDEKTAIQNYQAFKEEIIANLPEEDFEVEIDVEEWLSSR